LIALTRSPDSAGFEGLISIAQEPSIDMAGSIFPKNKKSGIFSAIALDFNTGTIITLLGNYKLNKTGALTKVRGKFILQDFSASCLINGSFKTKLDPDALPPGPGE